MLHVIKKINKGSIMFIELLTHNNLLQPLIPFYRETLEKKTNRPDAKYYQTNPSQKFDAVVANNLYMRSDYKDSIYQRILESDLRPVKSYRYSDLPFYLLQKYIEEYYDDSLRSEERSVGKVCTYRR